jgi:Ca2+-binding RTX toxin-like protein
MRQTVLLFTTMTAALLLASGVALAATVKGTPGNDDNLVGTPKKDNIIPYNGNDTVDALAGDDTVHHSYGDDTITGGPGKDTLRGGFGNDTIYAQDGEKDLADCAYLAERGDGATGGHDDAYVDGLDVYVDCKNVWVDGKQVVKDGVSV